MEKGFSKEEKTLLKWEHIQWLDRMANRFGCSTSDIGEAILEYERKFEKLKEDIR